LEVVEAADSLAVAGSQAEEAMLEAEDLRVEVDLLEVEDSQAEAGSQAEEAMLEAEDSRVEEDLPAEVRLEVEETAHLTDRVLWGDLSYLRYRLPLYGYIVDRTIQHIRVKTFGNTSQSFQNYNNNIVLGLPYNCRSELDPKGTTIVACYEFATTQCHRLL
jgi:hypothetical protein